MPFVNIALVVTINKKYNICSIFQESYPSTQSFHGNHGGKPEKASVRGDNWKSKWRHRAYDC